MKKYRIYGEVREELYLEIEANSKEEAENKAYESCNGDILYLDIEEID